MKKALLPRNAAGFEAASAILGRTHPDLIVSKRKLRREDLMACVRLKRQEAVQSLGFASRPFVLCGLPVKRPAAGQLLHERRNGQFVLQVLGHPDYGLPWGQDRLVPIFLATLAIRQRTSRITFGSAAEMLDTFGMQQGGSQYRRLVGTFQRIFGATTFFGTDSQRERAAVVHRDCQNMIVLSEEFYREVMSHPIPTDLEAAKALSSCPAALDLFMWVSSAASRRGAGNGCPSLEASAWPANSGA
jgi:hypothetical protein